MAGGVISTWILQPISEYWLKILSSPFALWLKDEFEIFNNVVQSYDLIGWKEYQQFTIQVWKDWIWGCMAIFQWLYQTLKPVWMVVRWLMGRILIHLYLGIQRIVPSVSQILIYVVEHVKYGISQVIQYERNLTPKQKLQQLGILSLLLLVYFIYRWLQTTTLFKRIQVFLSEKKRTCLRYIDDKKYVANKWIERKQRYVLNQKKKVTQTYRKIVNRISGVSSLLAMAIPHTLYVALSICLKVVMPSAITWLACETSATSLISWWYPLLWTIVLLHQVRLEQKGGGKTNDPEKSNENHIEKNEEIVKQKVKEGEKQKEKQAETSSQRRTYAAVARDTKRVFPLTKTSPSSSASASSSAFRENSSSSSSRRKTTNQPRMTRAARLRMERMEGKKGKEGNKGSTSRGRHHVKHNDKKKHEEEKPRSSGLERVVNVRKYSDYTLDEQVTFWLHYWNLYASLQCFKVFMQKTPILSRLVLPQSVVAQLELIFFIWVLFMDHNMLVLPEEPYSKESWQFFFTQRPPIAVTNMLESFYLPLYESTSNFISAETWEEKVVKKVTSLLDALVLIRFLSPNLRSWLLKHLRQMHSFVVPSITLSMPGFITQYAVLYVQYVVPNAHVVLKKESQVVYLQYWVLHVLTAAQLNYWSGLIWWIPFSTHGIYILWCTLSFTQISNRIYDEFEREMEAFGVLPSTSTNAETTVPKRWEETRTSKAIRAVIKLLPKAKTETEDQDTASLVEQLSSFDEGEEAQAMQLELNSSTDELYSMDGSERQKQSFQQEKLDHEASTNILDMNSMHGNMEDFNASITSNEMEMDNSTKEGINHNNSHSLESTTAHDEVSTSLSADGEKVSKEESSDTVHRNKKSNGNILQENTSNDKTSIKRKQKVNPSIEDENRPPPTEKPRRSSRLQDRTQREAKI